MRRRFCATVRSGTSAGSWKTGARPNARRVRGRADPAAACRATAIVPPSARITPVRSLDERALAGAVRAEQRVDLARLDDEVGASAARRPARSASRRRALRAAASSRCASCTEERKGARCASPRQLERTALLAAEELLGRVGRPRLDLQPCAVRRRPARRVVRLDLVLPVAVPLSHTCGVSLTHFWTFLPCSSLIAIAAPTPPIVAGFVTAAPRRPLTVMQLLQELVVVRADDRHVRLARPS